MSNDSNVSIDGEIDAGFTSYWDSDKHGQTVGGTTEDDMGSVETDIWPDEVDPEDLTEKQKCAISTAVKNPSLTTVEVADRCDYSQSAVHNALVDYAGEWYNDNFKCVGGSKKGSSQPHQLGERQKEILRLINNNSGISTGELADDLGISSAGVRKHFEKIEDGKYRVETGVEGYHANSKVYYPANSDGEAEKGDEWAQKEDDKRVDKHDSGESETQERDAQEILEVLKKTAVHQETKNALEVLEGYL